jgi:hypothetical protein
VNHTIGVDRIQKFHKRLIGEIISLSHYNLIKELALSILKIAASYVKNIIKFPSEVKLRFQRVNFLGFLCAEDRLPSYPRVDFLNGMFRRTVIPRRALDIVGFIEYLLLVRADRDAPRRGATGRPL